MFGKHPRPHHVDLDDVDVAGLRTEDLLVERQPLGRRVRGGNHFDAVAGLLRPRLDGLLAQLQFSTHGTAGDRQAGGCGEGWKPDAQAEQCRWKDRFELFHKALFIFVFRKVNVNIAKCSSVFAMRHPFFPWV
ncbi:hypothetical protein D3C78_1484040 [compost metagenome]